MPSSLVAAGFLHVFESFSSYLLNFTLLLKLGLLRESVRVVSGDVVVPRSLFAALGQRNSLGLSYHRFYFD